LKMTYVISFIDDIFANIWKIFQKMGPSALPDGDLAKRFFFSSNLFHDLVSENNTVRLSVHPRLVK